MLNTVVAGVTLLAIFLQVMYLGSPWAIVFKIVTFFGLLHGILQLRKRVRQGPETPTKITG